MEELEYMLNELPENRPLYKDSGLWEIRSDDMEEVLYAQKFYETFYEFIARVYINMPKIDWGDYERN